MPPIYPQPKCIKRKGSAYSAKCDCISCIFRKPWRSYEVFKENRKRSGQEKEKEKREKKKTL